MADPTSLTAPLDHVPEAAEPIEDTPLEAPETPEAPAVPVDPAETPELQGLRQARFTKEMQKLARQREALEAKQAALEAEAQRQAEYQDFVARVENDPAFVEAFREAYGRQTTSPAPPRQAQSNGEVVALTKRLEAFEQKASDEALDDAVDELKTSLPGFDPEVAVARALELQLLRHRMSRAEIRRALTAAHRDATYDVAQGKAKVAGQRDLEKQTQDAQRAALAGAASAPAPKPAYEVTGKKWSQITEDAKRAGRKGL